MTAALALSCAALAAGSALRHGSLVRGFGGRSGGPAGDHHRGGLGAGRRDQVRDLLPVVCFLAVVLVLAGLCDVEGLFRLAGGWMARSNHGHPRRLLGRVFLVATATTTVLSLDATAVLLTPVVLATIRSTGTSPRPHLYATAHLSNTASLLLPVSNLTNLLAFSAAGLSFTRFGVLMAGPWLVAVTAEYLLFRMVFRGELVDRPVPTTTVGREPVPVLVLSVLPRPSPVSPSFPLRGSRRCGRHWPGLRCWRSGLCPRAAALRHGSSDGSTCPSWPSSWLSGSWSGR